MALEKRYDPNDRTLTFDDGPDDLDFFYDEFPPPRARMSCGHVVTPMSLTNWCRRLLTEGKSTFECGASGCKAVWSYKEVCKMALLTPEEMKEFEQKLFKIASKSFLDVKACPGCKRYVMRSNVTDLSVICTVCTAKKQSKYLFCWQCLREWKGQAGRSDRCDNPGCTNQALKLLEICPEIVFLSVKGVTGCPSVRGCPTCGMLVEHDKTKCKNVVCCRCKKEFCFVCLKFTQECQRLAPRSWYGPCSTGVAPRQTSLPMWQRK